MRQHTLVPIAMISAALLVGGAVVFSQRAVPLRAPAGQEQNLRVLTLSVSGMVCAGCAASVESYLKAIPGVVDATASLTEKSAAVIYDPTRVTPERVTKNTIFDVYTPTVVSDEPYDRSRGPFPRSQAASIPASIQQKSNRVAQLLSQHQEAGADTASVQTRLERVNRLLADGRFAEAERLLDLILQELERP